MKASVLVNGSPTPEFSLQRGLRQGDPLSPFMFNILGEFFHQLMEVAKEKGLIMGVKISTAMNNFTHLQFADDTIIFLSSDVDNVMNMKIILQCFQLISGLKINFSKGSLFS